MLRKTRSSVRKFANGIFGGSGDRSGTIFSFVVDADPKYAYQGYHLARSLIRHSCDRPTEVHAQFTREVPGATRDLFAALGCSAHDIQRFGDGRYCNKIAQLTNLETCDFRRVVLLDTDTIALADIRAYLADNALIAKVVDLANPSISTLQEIAQRAGMQSLPPLVNTDAGKEQTYLGNCNGGFYGIPKALCHRVNVEWRRWASWLLDNLELLKREGKEMHLDQVAMWLAIHMAKIPYQAAPSNLNYYLHFTGEHCNVDSSFGIVVIHYHDVSLNALGQVEPRAKLKHVEWHAVKKANQLIRQGPGNHRVSDLLGVAVRTGAVSR